MTTIGTIFISRAGALVLQCDADTDRQSPDSGMVGNVSNQIWSGKLASSTYNNPPANDEDSD
jgi:hypothetical protein